MNKNKNVVIFVAIGLISALGTNSAMADNRMVDNDLTNKTTNKQNSMKGNYKENISINVNVINKTGSTISGLYLSKASSNNWGNDVLFGEKLSNREKRTFDFDRKNNCIQDIRVDLSVENNSEIIKTGDNGSAGKIKNDSVMYHNVNLCGSERLILKYDNQIASYESE